MSFTLVAIQSPTEEEGNTGNEQENPEEKPVVEKYELSVPGEDGQNGYYVSYPEIEVRHISEAGATWCRLENGGGEVIEQVLEENKAERHIRGGIATRRKYKGE